MTSNEPSIRPLTPADTEAFRALRLSAIADSPTSIWPTHEEETRRPAQEIAERLRTTDSQIVFGAFEGARLIGVTGLRRDPLKQIRHKAAVWGVFVEPANRRGGVARRLLEAAIAHARTQQVVQILLCVNGENARAQRLYQSIGFAPFGLEPRALCVGGRFYDELYMVLRLDGPAAMQR
jgi:RimJ/RimL family protein N-acetyltransferase